MAVAAPEIAQDLWSEVLLKLPAKDVAKLRCLSKFHRDLINGPNFIKKHNKVSVKINHVIYEGEKFTGFDNVVDFSKINSAHKLIQPLKSDPRSDVNCKLVASCMGILCYEVQKSDCLILWNPLKKGLSRKIPLEGKRGSYIFVHDSITDDIKVIVVLGERRRCFDMYSSKMNSWIEFSIGEFFVECGEHFTPLHPVFVEGTNSIYWWPFGGVRILAYNFSTYKFKKYVRPKTCGKNKFSYDERRGISSLDGCLCLYVTSKSKHYLDMWTMKEDGGSQYWTPVFRISHFINNAMSLRPIAFINNRSQLVILSHKHGLFLFDMETASIHTTELKKQLENLYSLSENIFVFTPSLREP